MKLTEHKTKYEHCFVDEQGRVQGEYKRWDWSGRLIDHAFLIDGEEIIHFLKSPELYPYTPEEKTMFALKYGSGKFIDA